jgi:hypothetical protein
MPTYIVESPEDSSWRNVAIPLIDPVLALLRTARWARGNSQGSQRAARENLKIADIGPRAPRVVWLRRVYSPSEVWQVNLWLDLRENLATEQMLGSPVFGGAVLIRSDIRLWSSRCPQVGRDAGNFPRGALGWQRRARLAQKCWGFG